MTRSGVVGGVVGKGLAAGSGTLVGVVSGEVVTGFEAMLDVMWELYSRSLD